jgi:hypothetical protein
MTIENREARDRKGFKAEMKKMRISVAKCKNPAFSPESFVCTQKCVIVGTALALYVGPATRKLGLYASDVWHWCESRASGLALLPLFALRDSITKISKIESICYNSTNGRKGSCSWLVQCNARCPIPHSFQGKDWMGMGKNPKGYKMKKHATRIHGGVS